MKKDLESWIRGGATHGAEAVVDASSLRLLVAFPPQEPAESENITGKVLNDVLNETEGEKMDTEIQAEPIQKAEEEINEEAAIAEEDSPKAEEQTVVPDREPNEYEARGLNEDDEGNHESHEKRAAWELLEEAGSRLTMRLKNIKDTRRVSNTYKRSGFRKDHVRLLTLCALAIIIIGTAIALYRNMQRGSYGAMMARAQELFGQEQYTDALEAFHETSRRHPDRIEPLLGIAHSAERMGRVEEAITAYRLSMERFPADAAHLRSKTFYEIGRLYAMLKAWEEAQESFERAVAADAANFSAYFSLGNSLEQQNQPDMALLAYMQALDLSPSSDAAREAVRRVSLALSAREEIEQAALVEQQFQQAIQSGRIALGDARFREASDYFAKALAIRSDDASAWVGFGEARFRLGDTVGAVRSMERALERNPEYERAKSRLAEIEAQNRRNTPQRRNNPRPRSQSSTRDTVPEVSLARADLFNAGVELFRKGEYEAAFKSFIACLRSTERDPLPSAPLAGSSGPIWKGFQTRLNVPPEARLLAEAVQLNPMDRDLYVNLAMAGTKMGMDRQAMRSALSEARSHAHLMASN